MLESEKHQSYSSVFLNSPDGGDRQLQKRLGLYQVFLKIYEQNKDLLNEILELENSGHQGVSAAAVPYVQGVVLVDTVYLVTNLLAGKTQVFPRSDAHWTIGRDSRIAGLPIADPRLSRRHAVIAYDFERQKFCISDLGSTNGTFANGEQIIQTYYLKDGDRVRMGGLGFTFFSYQIPGQSVVPTHQSESLPASTIQVEHPEHPEHPEHSTHPGRIFASGHPTHPVGSDRRQCPEAPVPDETVIVPHPIRPRG